MDTLLGTRAGALEVKKPGGEAQLKNWGLRGTRALVAGGVVGRVAVSGVRVREGQAARVEAWFRERTCQYVVGSEQGGNPIG